MRDSYQLSCRREGGHPVSGGVTLNPKRFKASIATAGLSRTDAWSWMSNHFSRECFSATSQPFFLETRIPELRNTEILREMAGIDGLLPVHGADLCLHLSFYRFY